MSRSFALVDPLAVGDMRVFLARSGRLELGSARLVAGSGVLAIYVPVLQPAGILDEGATVLGLRTYALAGQESFDSVVPIRSLLARVESALNADKVEGEPVEVTLPIEVNTVTWTTISPPRGGWKAQGTMPAALLETTAAAGIDEVATALPDGAGEQIVRKVRAGVWGRPLEGFDYIPGGAAFAAVSLGFVGDEETVSLFESGPWTRLTTRRGHVLVKRRAWNIAG